MNFLFANLTMVAVLFFLTLITASVAAPLDNRISKDNYNSSTEESTIEPLLKVSF